MSQSEGGESQRVVGAGNASDADRGSAAADNTWFKHGEASAVVSGDEHESRRHGVVSFATEAELVAHLESGFAGASSPWQDLRHGREFDYARGRTDVVAISREGELLAFEAKLDR